MIKQMKNQGHPDSFFDYHDVIHKNIYPTDQTVNKQKYSGFSHP